MMYDCFFSYQNKDLKLVEAIVKELEKIGFSCWYAPRNIKGRYAKAIADGILHCKIFVLILNERSAVSEAVLNEVEMAHNIHKRNGNAIIQPVQTEDLDFNSIEFQEMMYYIRRLQFVNALNTNDVSTIADQIVQSQPLLQEISEERKNSGYVVQAIEDERLKLQNELLHTFDNDVYQRVLHEYVNPTVLDVGCGTGDMLVPKLSLHTPSCFIGMDRSDKQITIAKQKYSLDNYHFFTQDVTSDDFETSLQAYMEEANVSSFDIINISMLLLHLKEPVKLLSILKKYISENGTVIIRDIDDGLNFAYPNPNNAFDRIYKMCDHDEQSGSRRNGRQVYHDLKCAGFTSVTLECQGLSSDTMNNDQKEALFHMYFPFTLENARIMMDKYPWKNEYKEDYLWYKNEFDNIHALFSKPEFIFSLGFVTYTAKV